MERNRIRKQVYNLKKQNERTFTMERKTQTNNISNMKTKVDSKQDTLRETSMKQEL